MFLSQAGRSNTFFSIRDRLKNFDEKVLLFDKLYKDLAELKRLKNEQSITTIVSQIPSNKTANLAKYHAYVNYIFIHLDHLFSFYASR